jgi:hypothetical protein
MIDNRDKLIKICLKNMQAKNLYNETYKDRFKKELQEIDNQEEHEYFLELYNNKNKFNNENNLLITYLLGLCDDFDINIEPAYSQGEFPDIDVDYLPIVQDYLRNEFCPKRFGRENVVNIGNYGTFGLKSALLDMARVYGADRMEIQTITKNLQDKDEEGKPVTWDKALELSPELNDYAKKYPEITDSAKRLIDRNRSRGKHAGGTVVSSVKIDDFVPIMIDTDGNPVSGWTEGLHDQDLQPVGLIKFDVLAIKDLLRIANCCKLVKQRHPEIKSISAHPDCSDWSDTAYLNDSKALKLGNEAKTRGVFQFDSEGMRNLVKSGGVDCFEDLVAYTALFRPSALKMQMHERYIQRKKGRETWEDQVPDCVRDILKNTYGVFSYQEQVMQVLNIVGDIPLIHCEKIRKAISKKKEKEFLKYKQMFLENGSKKTGWPIYSEDNKNMNFLWNQLEAFSGYGFNKSVDEHTYIPTPKGLKKIRDFQKGDRVYCIDESGNKVETEVVNLHDHGVLECYSIVFDDGYEITCTLNHKFLTQQGQIPLHEILKNNISVFCEKKQGDNYDKKEGSLDREMRRASPDQKIKKCSSNSLSKMSEVMFQDRRMEDSLRQDISSEMFGEKTSTKMPSMSKFSLGRQDMGVSLFDQISNSERDGRSSQNMQDLQKHKAKEHKAKKFKNKPVRGTSQISIRLSNKNLCSSRNSGSEIRESQKMERTKPRKVCQMHRGGLEKPQAIKNGGLVEKPNELDNKTNSLWFERKETSRFCKEKNLDRGGRVLSFLRTPQPKKDWEFETSHSSAEGQNAKRRMFTKKIYHFNKNRHVMFSNEHRSNENGVVEAFSKHASISETGSLVSRKIIRAVPLGKRHCYDLEVACSTHNFILPNGIVTSNSHACAYTYISSRLLYLKAHYPLEFFVVTLSLEGDEDKLKAYSLFRRCLGAVGDFGRSSLPRRTSRLAATSVQGD